ncbi:MAG: hypothetical protein Kow0069_18770 [Promethearchaeota archaeon]
MTPEKKDRKKKKKRRPPWGPWGPWFPPELFNDDFFDPFDDDPREFFEKEFERGMFGPFTGLLRDLLRQLGVDAGFEPRLEAGEPAEPRESTEEAPEERAKRYQVRGPFVYGFSLNVGPDGKPRIHSFGNVKPNKEGRAEVKDVRDPLVDIVEEKDHVLVVAEIPGVTKEDVRLYATEDSLTIEAESDDGSRRYKKTVKVPARINPDIAKASYRNGILTIRLTKRAGKKRGSSIPVE